MALTEGNPDTVELLSVFSESGHVRQTPCLAKENDGANHGGLAHAFFSRPPGLTSWAWCLYCPLWKMPHPTTKITASDQGRAMEAAIYFKATMMDPDIIS